MRTPSLRAALAVLAACALLSLAAPRPAAAINLLNPVCTVAGAVSGIAGKACNVAKHSGGILRAGKKLLGGHVGGAIKALSGSGASTVASVGVKAAAAASLLALGEWMAGGAHSALKLVAGVIGRTTRPQLRSTWFSSTYWRVAAISALLTLPFLFAAAVQALLRSDVSLLARAALGYLPLALLGVSIAAPLTMLLLAATDGMSAAVASAAGHSSSQFLSRLTGGTLAFSALSGSPFLACFIAVLVVMVSVVLWLELLVRDAAIYVVVLMLPLVFATLVWPARRVWAVRLAELLFALILSKFAIVAVLSLGGAVLGSAGYAGAGKMTLGLILVGLGATAPWVLMRLLPVTELAGSLHGMRSSAPLVNSGGMALESALGGHAWAEDLPALMRGADDSGADGLARAESSDEVDKLGPTAPFEPRSAGAMGEPDLADREPDPGPVPAADPAAAVDPPPDTESEPAMAGATRDRAAAALGATLTDGRPLRLGAEAFTDPPPPIPDTPATDRPITDPRVAEPEAPRDDRDPRPPSQPPEDGHL